MAALGSKVGTVKQAALGARAGPIVVRFTMSYSRLLAQQAHSWLPSPTEASPMHPTHRRQAVLQALHHQARQRLGRVASHEHQRKVNTAWGTRTWTW